MAIRITIERGDGDDIILCKKKGKITFDEVIRFLHQRDQLFQYDGDLFVWQFIVSDQHDMYDFASEMLGEPEGDCIVLQRVADESICPVCGKKRLFPQYCPDCGRSLDEAVK